MIERKGIQLQGAPLYLDMQATTPMDPRVVDAMLPFMTEQYGNPHSRTHLYGWEAEDAVEAARAQVGALIGAEPKEIIFTSGATESNNMAVKGVAQFYKDKKRHVITTQVHPEAAASSPPRCAVAAVVWLLLRWRRVWCCGGSGRVVASCSCSPMLLCCSLLLHPSTHPTPSTCPPALNSPPADGPQVRAGLVPLPAAARLRLHLPARATKRAGRHAAACRRHSARHQPGVMGRCYARRRCAVKCGTVAGRRSRQRPIPPCCHLTPLPPCPPP